MNDLKSKRLAVLESTLNYFTPSNRCIIRYNGVVGATKTCQYSPIEGVSEGCAIGRLIEDKDLCRVLDKSDLTGVSDVFESLPEFLKELGIEFLTELQKLHDNDAFWDNEGLNVEGEIKVGRIERNYID